MKIKALPRGRMYKPICRNKAEKAGGRSVMFNITESLQKMFEGNGEVTSVNAAETIDDGC